MLNLLLTEYVRMKDWELANYLKPVEKDTVTGSSRERGTSGIVYYRR